MSQEINLVNEALRPKRDVLRLRYVAATAGVALALILGLHLYARIELAGGRKAQSAAEARLSGLQQELKALQEALAARRQDPALAKEIERMRAVVEQRQEVLKLASGLAGDGGDAAEIMRGFARQRLEGVWLTGFSIGSAGIDIRGRLLDPALLPVYIRRLNGEPAFRGRQFAALDMQGVVPQAPAAGGAAPSRVPATPPPGAAAPARYTEFALKASLAAPGKEARE
ncbi:MAG: PilN domain-containing protein [Rhodocyclales bacterium]|nr:PilN domain-containing protein [Rhodocyclales bacterium]